MQLEHTRPMAEIVDREIEMPAWVQARHHAYCVAARNCYRLRTERGDSFEAIGDVYAVRADALSGEWCE